MLEIAMIFLIVILLVLAMVFFYIALTVWDDRKSFRAFMLCMACNVGWAVVGIIGSILFN